MNIATLDIGRFHFDRSEIIQLSAAVAILVLILAIWLIDWASVRTSIRNLWYRVRGQPQPQQPQPQPPPAAQPEEEETTSAVVINPFGNPFTFGVLSFGLSCIIYGIVLMIDQSWLGVILVIFGVFVLWKGYTEFDPGKREGGILTWWGHPITLGGIPVVVMGYTFVADWFPMKFGFIKIDFKHFEKEYPVTLYCYDMMLDGTIGMTIMPNGKDGIDFLQAGGKLSDIAPQIDDVMLEQMQVTAANQWGESVVKYPSIITSALKTHMDAKTGLFESKSFGVKVVKLNGRFKFVKLIQDAFDKVAKENYDASAELGEADTDLRGAHILQRRLGLPTLEEGLERYIRLRMLREQMITRIENRGGGRNVNVTHSRPANPNP